MAAVASKGMLLADSRGVCAMSSDSSQTIRV
jgi:hypothetical protein